MQSMRSGGRSEDVKIAEGSLAATKAKLQALLNGADDSVRQSALSAVDSDKDALASAQAAFAALGAQNAASLQNAQSQVDTFEAQINSAQAQITSADAALASLTGSSAADLQAAQSGYDQAYSELQTAQATLKQNYYPTQTSIAQAEAALIGLVINFVLLFQVNSEELVWRGSVLPRLQARWSALVASVVIGVFEGLFHLPLFFQPDSDQAAAGLPVFVIGAIAGAIIFSWVFNNTMGSLLLVQLFHIFANTWITLFAASPADTVITQWLFNGVLVLLAAVVLILCDTKAGGRLQWRAW